MHGRPSRWLRPQIRAFELLGTADKKLDTSTASRLKVRMHIKEDVELFLLARGDGMIVRDAASSPASGWAPPRGGRSGTCPGAAPAGPGARVESGATMSERPEGSPSEDRGQGAVRAARDGAARRDDARPDRETAAQGGVGQPKRGLAPPFDPDAEQVRARREIEAGNRSAVVGDYPFP